MKVIVVGCGRLGAALSSRLCQSGHEVTIVDLNEDTFDQLPADFTGVMVEGDALNRDVLRRAGAERADAVAVVTNSDMLNAVVGHLANEFYHVPHVVVRNNEPKNRRLLETFGLQNISAMSWGAQRIEEMIYHADVRVVFSAGNGEVEVYEVPLPENCAGRSISEFLDPHLCAGVALTRAGRSMLPTSDLTVEVGDVLLVSATSEGVELLRSRLCDMSPAHR